MGQNESETCAKITQKSKSANMTNFDSIGKSIKNVNKNANKPMPKNLHAQSYEALKVGVVPSVTSHQNFEVGKYEKL